MKLSQLINVKITFKETVAQQLLQMTTFFHDYMWNGYDDENDPKFVTKEDYEAIEALVDKINHMIFNIGCPNSVEPMLNSICTRKIKRWQADKNILTEDVINYYQNDGNNMGVSKVVKRGFSKGRQLKSKADIRIVSKSDNYYNIPHNSRILKGHFRWNNRAYMLSRKATDVLNLYCSTKF